MEQILQTCLEWWMPMVWWLVMATVLALTIAMVRRGCTLCTFIKCFGFSLVQRLARIFNGGKKLGKKYHFGGKIVEKNIGAESGGK